MVPAAPEALIQGQLPTDRRHQAHAHAVTVEMGVHTDSPPSRVNSRCRAAYRWLMTVPRYAERPGQLLVRPSLDVLQDDQFSVVWREPPETNGSIRGSARCHFPIACLAGTAA
jgi:hypothetical protein